MCRTPQGCDAYTGAEHCSSGVPLLVPALQPVVYNPSEIFLSDVQPTVLTNLDCVYLRVPRCRALLETPAHVRQ